MENSRNFLLTIILSIGILTAWQFLYMNPKIEAQREQARIEAERVQAEQAASGAASTGTDAAGNAIPAPQGTAPDALPGDPSQSVTREAALASGERIAIDTPRLSGSLNLVGARLDDIVLKDYRETINRNSDNIHLLNPASLAEGFFAEFGYSGNATTGDVPGPQTAWQAAGDATLTPSTPLTLTYDNGNGLTFTRTVSVDDQFMFTVSDQVTNGSGSAVSLSPYGRVTRFSKPQTPSIWVLHEGPIGVIGEEGLREVTYGDIEEEKEIKLDKASAGWLGITDKYWAATIVPPKGQAFQARFAYFDDGRARFQSDYLSDAVTIAPGETKSLEMLAFTGAKRVEVVDGYEASKGIPQFELLIDWGWFYFITKPLFYLIDWLFKLFGNFGVAILITTVIVKAIFFPLANKSYASMAKMKVVQPKMMEIRERYADDKMKQQQAMMELYKKEKINPVAGCWPVLLQIPVFFSLYKVLYVTIEMRHAPFFGWIQDLSAPDPTSIFNLFGLLPYDVPAFLLIGVWPLIMGITMFLQMQMNPTPPDPTQAMIFKWMPIMFTFMLATFPAGLVIYWAWNNFLSIIQQGVIMKRNGAKIELWDNLKSLFGGKKADTA